MTKWLFSSLSMTFFSIIFVFSACAQMEHSANSSRKKLTNEELLDLVQRQTTRYFLEGAEPNSGMGRERFHVNGIYPHNDKKVVTSGGSGFGIMAIIAAIERGYISREEGLDRFERILNFLETADRYHGAWSHWMYGETGKTKPFGRNDNGGDIVETAFLVQGLLCVRQYFRNGTEREQQIAARCDTLWREVEWDWYRGEDRENVLFWHWSPDYHWVKQFRIKGYNECLITYVLAASSPTYPIPPEVYHEGWARGGDIVGGTEKYGYKLTLNHNGSIEYGGPLFWAHYSYLGLDPRHLADRYANYWELNKNHTLINYSYCVENPRHYKGYSDFCWGLTASYTITGYTAHSPKNDKGIISPTAALASIPYTPDKSLAAMRYFYEEVGDRLWGEYGFYDAFSQEENWFPQKYLAIDQGPIPVMIENYRTGLLWDLFMSCPEIQTGLTKLGFTYTERSD